MFLNKILKNDKLILSPKNLIVYKFKSTKFLLLVFKS